MPHNQPILSPSSSHVFGTIPKIIDPFGAALTQELPIIVPIGDRSFGYTHVHDKHRDKIAHFHHGMDVIRYIALVTAHFHKIYIQPDGKLRLLKFNGIKNAIIVQHTRADLECYKLLTAYPLGREPNYAKRNERPIWP